MEVSFIDIIKIILKRWWIILITVILGAGIAFAVTSGEKPSYVSKASLLAEVVGNKEGDYSFSDLNYVHALIPTFYDIMNEDKVYDDIVEDLNANGVNITRDQLKAKFSFVDNGTADSQSLVFSVKCTADSKEFSKQLLEAFLDVSVAEVNATITSIELGITEEAHYVSTNTPNTVFNIILGLFIGAVVGLLIVFIINSLDTRFESSQDISKKYGIPVIGVIPTELIEGEE